MKEDGVSMVAAVALHAGLRAVESVDGGSGGGRPPRRMTGCVRDGGGSGRCFLPTRSVETSHRTPHSLAAVSWAAAHQVHIFFSLFCFCIFKFQRFLETKIIFEVS
jgi:hypothetical protein